MRLLIWSSELPPGPGGIGSHAHQLAAALHRRGWEVVLAGPQDYATEEEVEAFGERQPFAVARWRRPAIAAAGAPSRARFLARLVRRSEPQLLLASGEPAVWTAAWAARHPWVAVVHGSEVGRRTGWRARLTRRALARADAVVCVSEYTRQRLAAAGIAPRRLAVIPNGADADRFHPLDGDARRAVREGLGVAPDEALLVTVGHLSRRKGQDIVVRALPAVVAAAPRTRYLMVGLPTERPRLAALAAELGVAEHLLFAGRVAAEQVVSYLGAADVFVLTSREVAGDFEGYGIAAVEAALCATPAVVAGGSGLAEAVVDGETALVVPPEDPGATADALLTLLADPELRRRLGEAARRRALAEQSWERRAEAYARHLEDAAEG